MIEQKICEAFEKQFPNGSVIDAIMFTAGYMTLLNELEPVPDCSPMFYLPEGVEK
jgi:hypothetical protein